MAEEQSVEEQESAQQQETSKLGRLKGQLKKVVGRDSDEDGADEETSAEAGGSQDGAQASGEEDSGDEEGSESHETEDHVGDYSVDDVDMDKHATDEDEARAQIKKLEKEGPPDELADWPTGKAMYLTFGGAEGEQGYEDGVARQMGPSSTRHLADGSVEVQGETADDPSEYKREETVGEEADKIGMDKGAKTEDDEESGGEEGESSSNEDSEQPQSEGEGSSSSEAEENGSTGGDSEQQEEQAARS